MKKQGWEDIAATHGVDHAAQPYALTVRQFTERNRMNTGDAQDHAAKHGGLGGGHDAASGCECHRASAQRVG